jgi:hypothetical protein
MGKKVLRYTEEEFITLLENIVKRVKQEETLNESKKEKYDTARNIVRRNRK